MKVRDSGMPPQDYGETLRGVTGILDAFGFGPDIRNVAELGGGYGPFTVPLARRIAGTGHTTDLEADMVAITPPRAVHPSTSDRGPSKSRLGPSMLASNRGPAISSFHSGPLS